VDDESKRFRLSLYGSVLLHALADAAIVYFLGGVLIVVWWGVMYNVFGVRAVNGRLLSVLLLALTLAAGIRAAYGTARSRIVAHRRARGLCLHCGYDLRASTHHCPECGRSIRAARYGSMAGAADSGRSPAAPAPRRHLQATLTGVYTFILAFFVLGGPASLVVNLIFGESAAEWTLGGFFVLSLALAVVASVGSRQRKLERDRRAHGLCPGCGYDVRASGGRCSECGRYLLR
jgi:predicted RNA-binding Zn-ribbon protein involved in translation (DUF1610 family)